MDRLTDASGFRLVRHRPKRRWCKRTIHLIVRDDVYLPHSFEEIQKLVTPEVAAKLNPRESYGVWWFNRRRTTTSQITEAGENGRRYRKHVKIETRPREEWIAVPVVNAGIPREVVEMAREAIKDRYPTRLPLRGSGSFLAASCTAAVVVPG